MNTYSLSKSVLTLLASTILASSPLYATGSSNDAAAVSILFGTLLSDDADGDDDFDGLTNGFEEKYGTDPLNADSDNDGISDAAEDEDGDGLYSLGEQLSGTSPLEADSDNDGLTDGFQYAYGLTGGADVDSDGDGLTNLEEKIAGSNPMLADTDGDGIIDGDEVSGCSNDPLNDIDGDGVCENIDNCPDFANSDQLDEWPLDSMGQPLGDGIGDACQCGDLDSNGQVNDADWNLINPTPGTAETIDSLINDLPLAGLERCDISGDGLCTSADHTLLRSYLDGELSSSDVRGNCPTAAQKYDRALGRLGYGADNESREAIRESGLQSYINQQLNHAENDSELDSLRNLYASNSYPTLGKSTAWLRARYCFSTSASCVWLDNDNDGVAETNIRLENPDRIREQLTEIKLLRSIYSNNQLDAVLRDFWFNHFNVYGDSGYALYSLERYENIIAEHMYGDFSQFVIAITKEPAMLAYLNLKDSSYTSPNENYAREVMELHTVGIHDDTADNIRPATKILTGYTLNNSISDDGDDTNDVYTNYYNYLTQVPQEIRDTNDEFQIMDYIEKFTFDGRYQRYRHDTTRKEIKVGNENWVFDENSEAEYSQCAGVEASAEKDVGEYEMELFLCLLANHTKSAEMIGGKLIERFIGQPEDSSSLMTAISSAWGQPLIETVRTVLTYPADDELMGSYFERSLYLEENKVKRPLVYSSSVVRTLGQGSEGESLYRESTSNDDRLASFTGIIGDLELTGDGLYLVAPPTGHPETSEPWVGATAFITKVNQAYRIVNGVDDITTYLGLSKQAVDTSVNQYIDPTLFPGRSSYDNHDQLVDELIARLATGGTIDATLRNRLIEYLDDNSNTPFFTLEKKVNDVSQAILTSPSFMSH